MSRAPDTRGLSGQRERAQPRVPGFPRGARPGTSGQPPRVQGARTPCPRGRVTRPGQGGKRGLSFGSARRRRAAGAGGAAGRGGDGAPGSLLDGAGSQRVCVGTGVGPGRPGRVRPRPPADRPLWAPPTSMGLRERWGAGGRRAAGAGSRGLAKCPCAARAAALSPVRQNPQQGPRSTRPLSRVPVRQTPQQGPRCGRPPSRVPGHRSHPPTPRRRGPLSGLGASCVSPLAAGPWREQFKHVSACFPAGKVTRAGRTNLTSVCPSTWDFLTPLAGLHLVLWCSGDR